MKCPILFAVLALLLGSACDDDSRPVSDEIPVPAELSIELVDRNDDGVENYVLDHVDLGLPEPSLVRVSGSVMQYSRNMTIRVVENDPQFEVIFTTQITTVLVTLLPDDGRVDEDD